MTSMTPVPSSVPVPAPPAFNRHQWERAICTSELFTGTRAVALVLAHLAGSVGRLPAGGPQALGRLADYTGQSQNGVRQALSALQDSGFITRPDIHTWTARQVWPITLTFPPASTGPAQAAEGATRTEPDHPGEVAS